MRPEEAVGKQGDNGPKQQHDLKPAPAMTALLSTLPVRHACQLVSLALSGRCETSGSLLRVPLPGEHYVGQHYKACISGRV